MQASIIAANLVAAAPAAGDAPSVFRIDGVTAFLTTVFGLILVVTAIWMGWRSKKAKVSENGTVLANIGLASIVFIIGAGAVALPFAKSLLSFFFNVSV